MHQQRKKKLTLASVFFTFFVDNLCWSIVFPIFAPYFLDPGNRLFSPDISVGARTTMLGLFLMAFSLGQFFGSPFLGEVADKLGRKKALAVSVLCTVFGMALTAWSMQINVLWLLFIGRMITGVFASNLSVCLACVSDLSPSEAKKLKYFGYLSFLAGLSFVFGAYVGGKLSDSSVNTLFTPYFPIWLATALTLVNFLFILFGFQETASLHENVKFTLLEGVRNIHQALKTKKIKRIYSIYFLFLFAWTILFQFTPVLVVERFQFTNSDIGELAIFMGICWALGSTVLNKILTHRFKEMRILEGSLVLFTLCCGLIVLTRHFAGTFALIGLCVLIGGLAWPLCTAVISNLAPKNFQGKILGMSQSMQSLAMSIAPVAGGAAYRVAEGLPFLLASAAGLIALGIYFLSLNREK